MMRSVLVTVAFLAVFALAVPTAWAGIQFCRNTGVGATAPCGQVITNEPTAGESCLGYSGCPTGKKCTPIVDETEILKMSFVGAECAGVPGVSGSAPAGAGEVEGDPASKPVTFTPNVVLPGFPITAPVSGRTAGQYIRALYVYFVGVVGVLAVAMIMYAGFLWITAAGNATRVTQAKEQMNAAVIGLILTLTSFLLLQLINPELVKLRDFNLPIVPKILQSFESQESSEKGAPPVSFDASKMGNLDAYDAMFLEIACNPPYTDRDFAFKLKAIMTIESSGNPNAESHPEDPSKEHAWGLMQLLPATAGKTIDQLKDPKTNIAAGAAYVRSLMVSTCPATAKTKVNTKTFKRDTVNCNARWQEYGVKSCVEGNWNYIAAAYNGGPGANCASSDCPGKTWWECEENGGFKETRNYVVKFDAAYKVLKDKNWLPECPARP